VLAADLVVQSVADGLVVVVDAAFDVVDPLLDRFGALAVGPSPVFDALLDTALQLGEGVGRAQACAEEVEDQALDPVLVDRKRGAHRRPLVEVAAAIVTQQVVGLSLAVLVLSPAAGEVAAATVTPDEAAEQVLDVLFLRASPVERAFGGEFSAPLEETAVHQRFVGVLDDDLFGLGVGHSGAVLTRLAPLEPHAVAHVGAVVEDVVDGRGVPVLAAWCADGFAVERVGDALAAHPLDGCHVEDPPEDSDFLLRSRCESRVLSSTALDDPFQTVAVGNATAVAIPPLGILPHPLDCLGGQVHRVELVDDLDHPFVQEALWRLRVVVLGDRLDRDAVFAQQRFEQDRLLAVAREAVELVHQDQVHVVAPAERDHLTKTRALVRRSVGGLPLVDEALHQSVVGALFHPAA